MATIPLNIQNGTAPYTISVKIVGDASERFVSYSNSVLTFNADESGVTKTYAVSVTDSEGCTNNGTFQLNCSDLQNPSMEYDLFAPYCSTQSGGSIVNGYIRLKNITNATRYKICYNTQTFSSACQSTCATSDGVISGSTVEIPLLAPAQGVTQHFVLRVYNGNGCDAYTDIVESQYSQRCSADEISMIIVDIRINAGQNPCFTPPANDFTFYAQVTNSEIAEKNQKAIAKTGINERNVPNNKEVPNVYISAPKRLGCGPAPFYRFGFNIVGLKSDYPGTNVFTFDIYGVRSVGANTTANNIITPQTNTFKGVRLVNKDYPAGNGGPCCFSDFFRDPLYDGTFVVQTGHIYNNAVSGFRKIGTLTYNYGNNTTSWVTAT